MAEEDFDQVLAYMCVACRLRSSPSPQESLLTSDYSIVRTDEKRQAASALHSVGSIPPLQKSVDKDHFYAVAEIAE
jgi:hypothetical protein